LDVGKTTLTKPQRAQLRTMLEEEQARLRRELPLVTASLDLSACDHADVIDVGTAATEREVSQLRLEQVRDRLDQVEAALARLETPAAGSCEGCGAPIPFERLELRPTATNCVRCAPKR
jgi:DnaK suppressor protein